MTSPAELQRLEEDLLALDRLTRQEEEEEARERALLQRAEEDLKQQSQTAARRMGGYQGYSTEHAVLPEDEAISVRRVLMDQEERAFRAQRELEELRYRRQLFEAQQRNDYFRGLLRYVQEAERRRQAEEREVDRLRSRMHKHRLDAMVNEELIRRDAARRALAPDAEESVMAAKKRMEELEAQVYFQRQLEFLQSDEAASQAEMQRLKELQAQVGGQGGSPRR